MSETFNQPPQSIAQTIEWLHKILGRPALPECPQECERDCAVPGGKAPAWINRSGKAIKVTWTPYQSQLPTQADLKKWFALTTGIGTLGGGPNTQGHYIGFVDLDHKEGVFSSTEVFEARLHQWLSDYPLLQQSPRFCTPSGGYRVILAFTEKPDWTAFSLDLDGQRMGELLARNGGHTLLPPTLGANGIAYQWEYFVAYPPVVQRPEDVGIFPTRRKHIQQDILPRSLGNYVPGAIRLEDLISTHAKDILIGGAKKGDRSDAINALAQECYGWEEFCRRNSIPYTGSTQELVQYAWGQMEDAAIDPNKWQRILKTINPVACQTAAEYRSGDEQSCWKKIYRLERTTFEDKCPPHIKDRIKAEWGMDRRHQAESSGGGKLQEPNAQEPRTNVVKQSESRLSKVSSLVEGHQQLDSDNKHKENILLQYIDTLLERGNIPQSERKAEYAQIGQALELDPKYVEQVAASRVQERQLAEVCNEKALIEELRSKRKTGLDLYEILPNEIASTLSQVAMALPTSPEHLITTGWSTFGAMIGTAAEIVAWPGFKQKTPVLWTISTARSGKLKSQTQEVMINPIRLLQREANNEYRIALKSYNHAQKAALRDEDSDSANSLPPPPVPREYWVEHITVEALIRTINENPRGFLVYRDEIDGFFKALNKYRSGKGDDEAFYLTLNNGGGPKVILIERERRVDVERSCVPITGTIQRKTLDEEMTPQKISSGWMARWVTCLTDMPQRRRTRLPYPDVDTFLKDIYRKLSVLKMRWEPVQNEETGEVLKDDSDRTVYQGFPIIYQLSPEAADYYEQHFFEPMIQREEAELNEGFQLVLSKWSGYCLRIAIILHCLHEVCKKRNSDGTLKTYFQLKEEWKRSGGETTEKPFEIEIPTTIGADIIKKAVQVSYFYVNQAEVLYLGQQQDDDDMVPIIERLIQKSEELLPTSKEGWITTREGYRFCNELVTLAKSHQLIASDFTALVFNQMVSMGIGEVKKVGKSLKWRSVKELSESSKTDTPFPNLNGRGISGESSKTTSSNRQSGLEAETPTYRGV